jgi:hypothetical protein
MRVLYRATTLAGLLAAAVLTMRGFPVRESFARVDSETARSLRTIAGGHFEASGLAAVPGTDQLLFVDDDRTREIFVLTFDAAGLQRAPARSIPLGADVTDLEGVTTDGRYFYVVGSQSKHSGFDGDGLVRFRYDPASFAVTDVQAVRGLKAWLAANVPELSGAARRSGDRVLNIEGLAWDPVRKRMLLGLRAPLVKGHALVVPLRLRDEIGQFTADNLRLDGSAIRLDLGGTGIRGMEFDEETNSFHVITSSWVNRESKDFRLVEWDGVSIRPTREITTFSRRYKPEGIARTRLNGRSTSVVVFDVGLYTVLD